MGLFGDIKNWFINTWNVSQHFDPCFKNFQRDLSSLKIINEEVDSEITRIYNQRYIEENKKDVLFDNINGRGLDSEKRESVLTDELSTLIVAGAGSGKTLTICGKVKYLLEKKNVKPSDVLLLSYSRNSAEDLQRKVSKIDPDLTVGTFHKTGLIDSISNAPRSTYSKEHMVDTFIKESFGSGASSYAIITKDGYVVTYHKPKQGGFTYYPKKGEPVWIKI